MPKKFWQFRNQAAGSAELLLYGDISDSSWWGDEVTPKTFADELNALGALTSLTVRINSGGGDVFAAQTIGNLLEQHTAQVTARIDGLCASAATITARTHAKACTAQSPPARTTTRPGALPPAPALLLGAMTAPWRVFGI